MTTTDHTPATARERWDATVNWDQLADRLQTEIARLMHHDPRDLTGHDLYREALHTIITNPTSGLTITAEADHVRETHNVVDRVNRATAERELADHHRNQRYAKWETRIELADQLRRMCHPGVIPSKMRREGWLAAADHVAPVDARERLDALKAAQNRPLTQHTHDQGDSPMTETTQQPNGGVRTTTTTATWVTHTWFGGSESHHTTRPCSICRDKATEDQP